MCPEFEQYFRSKSPQTPFYCIFGWLEVRLAWSFLNKRLDACVHKYLYGACSVVSIKWYLHERDQISVRPQQRKWPWIWVYGANSSKLSPWFWFICPLQCLGVHKAAIADKRVQWNMPNATTKLVWRAFQPASRQIQPLCEFNISLFALQRSECVLLSGHKILSPFRGFVILKHVRKDRRWHKHGRNRNSIKAYCRSLTGSTVALLTLTCHLSQAAEVLISYNSN